MIGSAGAYAAALLLQASLFGVTPAQPSFYVVSALTIVAVGATASVLPSLRACRIAPIDVLRTE